MDTESENYKVVRELLASSLWQADGKDGDFLPWRHQSHSEAREEYRGKADALLLGLDTLGIKIDVLKKAKAMASLRALMVEPEHMAYTLPGVEV